MKIFSFCISQIKQNFRALNLFFLIGLMGGVVAQASNPLRVCKANSDCVLVNNPSCTAEFNKTAVNKKSRKKLAARRCKKTTYKISDTDSGVSLSAQCVAKECTVVRKN